MEFFIFSTGLHPKTFSVSFVSNTTNFGSVIFGAVTVMLKELKGTPKASATDSAISFVLIALELPTTHSWGHLSKAMAASRKEIKSNGLK